MNLTKYKKHKKIYIYAKSFSIFGSTLVFLSTISLFIQSNKLQKEKTYIEEILPEKDFIKNILISQNMNCNKIAKTNEKIVVLKTNDSKDNIKLKGISTFNDSKIAIFELIDSKKQYLLKEGDSIENYKVSNIFKEYVCLSIKSNEHKKIKKSPTYNFTYSPKSKNIEKVSEYYFKIKRNLLLENLRDPQKLLSSSRIIPKKIKGNTTGFLLKNVKKGSFLNLLGLQDGDIIIKINGESFNNMLAILNQFTKIKDKKAIYLEILRNKKLFAIEYELK